MEKKRKKVQKDSKKRSNRPRYLIATDYDGTQFDTISNVEEAYCFAIEQVFGEEGVKIFMREEGLRNRAPSEIVEDIVKYPGMLEKAEESFKKTAGMLTDTIPCIVPLEWIEEKPVASITELLIRQKLRLLMAKISKDWPKPCQGVPEFMETLTELSAADGVHVDLAILSAGHVAFIQKSYQMQNLHCPELLATDDHFRYKGLTPEYRRKPAKALFDYVYDLWVKTVDGDGHCSLDHVVYAGDCPIRDGGLALNAEIPFIWFNPAKQTKRYPFPLGSFQISSWSQVARFLRKYEVIKMMKLGKTTSEIFCPCQY